MLSEHHLVAALTFILAAVACSEDENPASNRDAGETPAADADLPDADVEDAGDGPDEGRIVHLELTRNMSCVLLANGEARCWGEGADFFTTRPPGPFRQIAVAEGRFCGIRTSGEVFCGPDGFIEEPPIDTWPHIAQIAVSSAGRTCSLRTDGGIACFDQAGLAGYDNVPDGSFTQFSVGLDHGCGLLGGSRNAVCFGDDTPVNPELNGPAPDRVGPLEMVRSGRYTHCGLRPDATIVCWGFNDFTDSAVPPEGQFASIAYRGSSGCALDVEGRATCWGSEVKSVPVDLPPFRLVATDTAFACGVTFDDQIRCWSDRPDLSDLLPPSDLLD